jgi:hypothetical protein
MIEAIAKEVKFQILDKSKEEKQISNALIDYPYPILQCS